MCFVETNMSGNEQANNSDKCIHTQLDENIAVDPPQQLYLNEVLVLTVTSEESQPASRTQASNTS